MAIPNEDKKIRQSQKFNEELQKHLKSLGWTEPQTRDSFVAVLNSYMFSGSNASQQTVITNYLERGLDVLNIELKRADIQDDEGEVTRVTPDDVKDDETDPSRQVESISPMTYKQIITEGRNKRLSTTSILKEELKSHPRKKKLFKKLLESKDSKNKNRLVEATINALLSERVLLEQGDVNKGNFRTFFGNYLNDDKSWSADATDSIINSIISIVEKSSGNINAQKTVVRETDLIIDRLGKITDLKTATQTKNSQIAFQELATLSSKLRGWSSEFYSEFINNILNMIGTAKSGKVQSFVTKKLSDVVPKIKTDSEKEEPKEKEGEDDAKDKGGSQKKEG